MSAEWNIEKFRCIRYGEELKNEITWWGEIIWRGEIIKWGEIIQWGEIIRWGELILFFMYLFRVLEHSKHFIKKNLFASEIPGTF